MLEPRLHSLLGRQVTLAFGLHGVPVLVEAPRQLVVGPRRLVVHPGDAVVRDVVPTALFRCEALRHSPTLCPNPGARTRLHA